MRINDTKLSSNCDSNEGKNRNTTSSSIIETTRFEVKTRDYITPLKKGSSGYSSYFLTLTREGWLDHGAHLSNLILSW